MDEVTVTLPCIDIIGVLPVLYTHLQLVFEFRYMLVLVFSSGFVFEYVSELLYMYLYNYKFAFVHA